jgi:hypothetical protein
MDNEDRSIERIKRFGLDCKVADRCFHNCVEYVDLGLPSGTKWATTNVGAKYIGDGGLYFSWGDTQGYTNKDIEEGKKLFRDGDYKFGNYFKYNKQDGKTVLDLEDDAAHVNLGGSWRMPTAKEVNELICYTFQEPCIVNSVVGTKFISKKDKSKWIFIPPYCGNLIFKEDIRSVIWTSTTHCFNSLSVAFCIGPRFIQNSYFSRSRGFQVRGVFN